MDSVDFEVLHTAHEWWLNRHQVWLATVVRTWGSAPRPIGSLMAIREDGHVVGSVSGGCIEDDLIRQARAGQLDASAPSVLVYGASAEEARRFELPCGGTLQIVLEPVTEQSALQALAQAVGQRQSRIRTLDLQSGSVRLEEGRLAPAVMFDGIELKTWHGPRHRLLIVGAAQVSRYLASMALALDYHVIVCDPREEYLAEWDIEGVELSSMMPDDLILDLKLDSDSAIVTLTHDPKLDDMALLEALKCDAFYVGAIGSRKNNEARRQRLALFDLTEAEIARLHGPVGLHIGARTPPEIAISILAEMTAVRNGVDVAPMRQRPAPSPDAVDAGCAQPLSACSITTLDYAQPQ